jgi:tRNA(Ile)-lysidine synthase TilS/MesJ
MNRRDKMGKSGLSDSTFYVTKRVGRVAHEHGMIPDKARVGVAVSGGPLSATLLQVLVARQRRIPTAAEFVPIHLSIDSAAPANLCQLAKDLGLAPMIGRLWPSCSTGYLELESALATVAAGLGLDSIALADSIDRRAAEVLGSLLGSGQLASLPIFKTLTLGKDQGGALSSINIIRPFGWIEASKLCDAAMDNGLLEFSDENAELPEIESVRVKRLDLYNHWLTMLEDIVPARRMDFLTNLAKSSERVRQDYLT